MKLEKGVTVFTPTYNREKVLYGVYESLKKQSSNNFEWLIVDDGSSDGTKLLVENWINEGLIDIKYIFQENQGKMIAHNTGVKNARYNLFFCVDSDDYVAENTVELINQVNDMIYSNKEIIGIIGYKQNVKKITKRENIKAEYLTVSELYRKYRYKDEIALIYKTELLNEHLFPKLENEKFIPESYLYDRLDNEGKCFFLKEEIYYYEYLNDGYTNNTAELLRKNIKGYLLYSKQRMLISKLYQNVIRGAIQYNIACLVANKKWDKDVKKYYPLLCVTWLPSYLYYIKKYK